MQKDRFASLDTDPLSEMFDAAAAGATPAPVKTPPASYVAPEHKERCPKCAGSGQTRWGRCFRCGGKGSKTYKTSATHRANLRQQAANRAQRTAEENLAAFAASHPDVFAWMDGSTFDFAVSLRQAVARYGSLTENQLAAARRSIEKFNAAKAAREARAANAPVIEIGRIEAAFQTARSNGLKKLKLRIAAFTFKPAKEGSNNPGAIYVTRGGEYLGKIMSGRFQGVRACDQETEAAILAAAADPKAAAIAHGKLTGMCSCCGRELTDPESIAAGIGPVCATKWGL